MDGEVLEQILRARKISAEDLLRQTVAERVDGAVEILLRHLPYDEVRRALYERIAGAPLADFEILRMAYFKHFEHAKLIASASGRSVLSYLVAASASPSGVEERPAPLETGTPRRR